jgi:hypothetical protein
MARKDLPANRDGRSVWPPMVGIGVLGFGLITALHFLVG